MTTPTIRNSLNGIMSALFAVDYTLALCPKLVQHSQDGLISDGRFDGVLWCRPDFSEASLDGLRHSSTPVVMMHAPPGSAPGVPTFCADNEGAYQLVVQHLVGLGHKRIGFVIDPVNEHTAEGRFRAASYASAMAAVGLESALLVWDYEAKELETYVGKDRPYTALAAFSDTLAGHLLTRCARLGILVPHDLSIVGFDSSSFCDRTSPRLTSINQPVELMAREATNYLLNRIDKRREGVEETDMAASIYPCRLDIRDSTAPPLFGGIH